jgi:hypothetical protein
MQATQQALEDWLEGLPALHRQRVQAGLQGELDKLYRARYAAQPTEWQGAALLRRTAQLRGAGAASRNERQRLNP